MLCPQELAVAVTAAANVVSERLEADDLAVLAAVLVQLGDTLATLAAQQALLQSRYLSKNEKEKVCS